MASKSRNALFRREVLPSMLHFVAPCGKLGGAEDARAPKGRVRRQNVGTIAKLRCYVVVMKAAWLDHWEDAQRLMVYLVAVAAITHQPSAGWSNRLPLLLKPVAAALRVEFDLGAVVDRLIDDVREVVRMAAVASLFDLRGEVGELETLPILIEKSKHHGAE